MPFGPPGGHSHPIFARVYQRVGAAMDRGGMTAHRRQLLDGLAGQIIEIGAGNGLNFAHYPSEVAGVVAVEPEPYLCRAARVGAATAPVPVRVIPGVAEFLPSGDGRFDAAVTSLVLCSVRDQRRTLAELFRVLRPGGQLRFLEHVRADSRTLRRVQRAADATLRPVLAGGCRSGRDTVGAIEGAGFVVTRLERFRFPDGGLTRPTAPHVLGVARRPDDPRRDGD